MAPVININDLIASHGGFITVKDIPSSSIYHRLLSMVKDGDVVRVSPGVYASQDTLANTMLDITKIVPGGILCQYSAWFHYRLTTQIPSSTCVAVKRGRRLRLPLWPPFTLYYRQPKDFELGLTTANVGGYDLPIYDMERCVCDAIKSRNKIGIDVSTEIIKNYLARTDRDLNKLMAYAHRLRVANILTRYLEIALS